MPLVRRKKRELPLPCNEGLSIAKLVFFGFIWQVAFVDTIKTYFEPNPGDIVAEVFPDHVHGLAVAMSAVLLPEVSQTPQRPLTDQVVRQFESCFDELGRDNSFTTMMAQTLLQALFKVYKLFSC